MLTRRTFLKTLAGGFLAAGVSKRKARAVQAGRSKVTLVENDRVAKHVFVAKDLYSVFEFISRSLKRLHKSA